MEVNFSALLYTIEGKDLVDGGTKAPIPLRMVAINALQLELEGEKITGEEKLKRWKFSQRIDKAGDEPCSVTANEIVLLKDRLSHFPINIVGPAYEILEGEAPALHAVPAEG